MGARLAGEVEGGDRCARLECCQAHRRVRVRSGPSAGVNRVAARPVPNLQGAARADWGEAVPMGVGGVVARAEDPMDRLQKLKTMLVKGLISQAEYDNKKAEILAAL